MKWIKRHKVISGLLVVVALIVGIVAASSGSSKPPVTTAVSSTSPVATLSSAPYTPPPTTAAPTTAAPAPVNTPSTPAMAADEQQAVDAAQNYLDLGSGFSYQGLLKQLTSSYGNGFPTATAVVAISYLHPDWDAQAVEAAKSYMSLGEGFSRASLIQQLTSSYGSGFTEAQAEYAANKVGL
jgi:hypothetical protein